MRALAAIAILGLWVTGAAAQEPPSDSARLVAQHAPLFASHDVLELRLDAPLRSIFRERGQESTDHPSTTSYLNTAGDTVRLDVGVRTRGNFRLQARICRFPPLRLNFRTRDMAGTLFEEQDRLKLVTHCQTGRDEYEQYTLQEYLVYRLYNLLTEVSFRVRLARITYVNTERDEEPVTRYAFLIEDEEMLATRLGWQLLEVPVVPPQQMDQDQLTLFEVFQYLIGNTDWSASLPEEGRESCCHNARVIGNPWGPVLPVPYDFDMAGIINTRYAEPAEMVGVRSVRERRFWGFCRPVEYLAQAFARFEDQREAIYDLYRSQADLHPRRLREALEYLDAFYEVIRDPRRAEREMVRRCRDAER